MLHKTADEIHQEIHEQVLREDIEPYLNKVYDGHVSESLVEQFRIAMMYLPPTAHKYSMKDIQVMATRRANEVTTRELGMMINVIYSIPFISMYGSLEEGIEKTMEFDKIREEYDKSTAAFNRKVEAKKTRLFKIMAPANTTGFNGLHKS